MMRRIDTRCVVYHHSLSDDVPAETVRRWHIERGFEDIGYHYLIHQDGTVEPGREVHLVGAHAPGRNSCSIGVCLLGDFRRSDPTPEQFASAARLHHALCRHYLSALDVDFHRAKDNPCPGPRLDRARFRQAVEAAIPEEYRCVGIG